MKKSQNKPIFEISDNFIQVTLPLFKEQLDLSKDEMKVYELLSKSIYKQMSEILSSPSLEFGKSKVTELLKKLQEKGIVEIEGNGRGTKYRIR